MSQRINTLGNVWDGGATLVQEHEGGTSDMPIGTSYELTTSPAGQAVTWTITGSPSWVCHAAFFRAGDLIYRPIVPTQRML